MPKEIPQKVVQRIIDLAKEEGFQIAFQILKRGGVIENLREQGINLSYDKFKEIWFGHLDGLIIKLHPGKTPATLADALGEHGIFVDDSEVINRLNELIKQKKIDPAKIERGRRGSKGPYRHSRQFIGVRHIPVKGLSLRKKPKQKPKPRPPKRRPGK